jgi:squalene-hopene/tetraprenyl-beta-curcumene cyclase
MDRPNDLAEEAASDAANIKLLGAAARRAIHHTRHWFLGQQWGDGSWCAELEGDCILESETILLLAFLGYEDSELATRCAAYLVEKQLPNGGWAMYPGGKLEISGSVKGLFRPQTNRARPQRRIYATRPRGHSR